jgi:hypothetical protein
MHELDVERVARDANLVGITAMGRGGAASGAGRW